ncbi:hypothetical protein F2Q69_00015660 [Brassica cretica]|uniref:Uncharacterized protein n=1 Tax=Brassica cretica TaxID=69181 RepID=A0A8S9QLJ0_BRACR|nr:hypothetical protein F2Q69_00015660 [Brassica cretica]
MDEEADDEYFRSGEGKQTMFSSDVYRDEMYNPLYLFGHHFPKPNEDEAWLKWKAWMTSANGNTMKFAHAEKVRGIVAERSIWCGRTANHGRGLRLSAGLDEDGVRTSTTDEHGPRKQAREVEF